MERQNVTYKPDNISYQPVSAAMEGNVISSDENQNNPVFENLLAEGGENFYHYINWLGLGKDPNLMILSSIHHYYYDFNDLRGIKTLINIKKLNEINRLDTFLSNVYRVLPPKASFIGCFKDNKIHGGIGVPFYQSSRLLNGLINLIDSKTDKFMTRKDVIRLLESHDFALVDMTEISSITFFCTESRKNPA
ncbi:MAG: hypothetical protein WAW07_02280 [Bacteroidales bacterium]